MTSGSEQFGLAEPPDENGSNKKARGKPSVPAREASDADWMAWAERWASWDPNLRTRQELNELLSLGRAHELREMLGSRLEFGTAGLRGRMGAGSNRMNDLVTLQSTQGVSAYLEQCFGNNGRQRGVCIGYDHRASGSCSSESFARHAAAVLLHSGFKVYFYVGFVATPLVPWCVEHHGCCAGIMITASHNPAADNGYKLYWENGAQIVPPHDESIAKLIEDNLEPWTTYNVEAIDAHPRCIRMDVDGEVVGAYFSRLGALCHHRGDNEALARAFPITYTAMHGVGHRFVERAFEVFGHGKSTLIGVEEQLAPDPKFPTVAFPNPEEGKGALELACKAAEAAGSRLVLANDPDADRLAVAERCPDAEPLAGAKRCCPDDASWHVFTGNELGALLGEWAWRCWRRANPGGNPGSVTMVASTVSSKFLASMAKVEGFGFVETLTGFKWMGSKTDELRKAGQVVIFAFEEAIGFCVGDVIKDKDGISGAAVFAELAKQLFKESKTCRSHLADLYRKYGHHLSLNSYLKCSDPALTRRIFARQRGGEAGSRSYCKSVGGVAVSAVRDLTLGYDSRSSDRRPALPLNQGGEMITYYFDALGVQVTLRTSGTEPKIKFYSEMRTSGSDPKIEFYSGTRSSGNGEAEVEELKGLVRAVVRELLDPVGNGLEVRAEDLDWLL